MKDNARIAGYVIIGILLMLGVAFVGMYAVNKISKNGNSAGEHSGARGADAFFTADPALLRYKELESIATGSQTPSAIAVDSLDRLYAAGNAAIRVFAADGSRLMEFPTDRDASCIAVAGDGAIYLGLKDHVEVFDAHGVRKSVWETPAPGATLTSISVSGSHVFAADAGNRTILQYDFSGILFRRIGSSADFVVPSPYFDVAVGADGLLRAANPGRHRIETYGPEGELVSWWGKPSLAADGFSGCCNPAHFAMLPDGSFVTSEKGLLRRIKIYGPQGRLECFVADTNGLGDGSEGLDVAVDSRSRILVLDQRTGEIRIFVPKDV